MRVSDLFESTLTELSRPSTRGDAEAVLTDAGYTQLGKGSQGVVYQKPGSPYVLKLFNSNDEAYANFIGLALRNPNPHFPKFFGKRVMVTPNYFAIRTEVLKPSTGREEEVGLIDRYIIQMRDYGAVYDEVYTYMNAPANVELKAACDVVSKFLKQNSDFFCDVHPPNVMLRGNTLVLTDPMGQHY